MGHEHAACASDFWKMVCCILAGHLLAGDFLHSTTKLFVPI